MVLPRFGGKLLVVGTAGSASSSALAVEVSASSAFFSTAILIAWSVRVADALLTRLAMELTLMMLSGRVFHLVDPFICS
ncbi:hypothetical protein GCM10022212_01050 [Actimicrobium antarcticum]|uniref:Secreted protein n=1 Tax=Actimicrobium antarcticum TaxID=1051899 RepID=A0ABP7SGX0_9BURK